MRSIGKTSNFSMEALPEPIDLDLDIAARMMYWTDRGDPPRGNTVNRAPMELRRPVAAKIPEDHFQPSHGGNWSGAGFEKCPHVLNRPRRFRVSLQSGRVGKEGDPVRGRKLERRCVRGNSEVTVMEEIITEAFRQRFERPIQSPV